MRRDLYVEDGKLLIGITYKALIEVIWHQVGDMFLKMSDDAEIRFCDACGNMLIPKKGKLYCKACDEEYELNSDEQEEYKIIKTIRHDDKEIAPIIVKEVLKGDRITLC